VLIESAATVAGFSELLHAALIKELKLRLNKLIFSNDNIYFWYLIKKIEKIIE